MTPIEQDDFSWVTCPKCDSDQLTPGLPGIDVRHFACVTCGHTFTLSLKEDPANDAPVPREQPRSLFGFPMRHIANRYPNANVFIGIDPAAGNAIREREDAACLAALNQGEAVIHDDTREVTYYNLVRAVENLERRYPTRYVNTWMNDREAILRNAGDFTIRHLGPNEPWTEGQDVTVGDVERLLRNR